MSGSDREDKDEGMEIDMSVAQLWEEQFSPEAVVWSAIEKRAETILGKPIDEMTEAEVEAKLAELQHHEEFGKEAQVDYVRGQVMAEGFMDRLKEAGVNLPEINEKLSHVVGRLNGASS